VDVLIDAVACAIGFQAGDSFQPEEKASIQQRLNRHQVTGHFQGLYPGRCIERRIYEKLATQIRQLCYGSTSPTWE